MGRPALTLLLTMTWGLLAIQEHFFFFPFSNLITTASLTKALTEEENEAL